MFFNKTKVQIVVPGYKIFPFSMRESWKILFESLKVPFKWIIHYEDKFQKTASQIEEDCPVILINDHHLYDLVKYINNHDKFGRGKDGRFWMGISTEKVFDSVFLDSEKKTRECAQICHFIAHFDKSAHEIITSEGCESLFCHQYVDAKTFKSLTPYFRKANQLLWVGKLSVGDISEAYQIRKKLFVRLQKIKGVYWREATRPEIKIKKIVQERDSFKGLINLPSNCPGYTSNFFEHLAMGGCTIQYKTSYNPPYGLRPGCHFIEYEPEDPESLLNACEKVLCNPNLYEETAEAGKQICLKYHTLEKRAEEIFTKASNEKKIWRDVSDKAKKGFQNAFSPLWTDQ